MYTFFFSPTNINKCALLYRCEIESRHEENNIDESGIEIDLKNKPAKLLITTTRSSTIPTTPTVVPPSFTRKSVLVAYTTMCAVVTLLLMVLIYMDDSKTSSYLPVIMAITSHWLPSPISAAHKKQRQRNTYSIPTPNSSSVHPSSPLGEYQQPWGSREDMMVDMNISPNMQGKEYLAHHSLLKLQFFFSMIFILFSILMIFLGRNTNVYLPILTTILATWFPSSHNYTSYEA